MKKTSKTQTQKGITLIALVITVIVLLILAGAAISIAINGSNIFEKSNTTVSKANAKAQEQKGHFETVNTSLDSYYNQYHTGNTEEVDGNIFTYNILTTATGKLDDIDDTYNLGKVADLSDTIKLADNTTGTAEITGINYAYIFRNIPNYPNAVEPGTEPDPYIEAIKPYIETLQIPSTVKLNSNSEFDKNGQTYNITSLGDKSFCASQTINESDIFSYTMEEIKNINMPNTITSIGNYAFSNCTQLSELSLPNSIVNIGDNTFENCTSIQQLTIHENVRTIGDETFKGCSSLSKLTINSNDLIAGDDVFSDCSNLSNITLSKSMWGPGFDSYNLNATDAVFNETPLFSSTYPVSVTITGGTSIETGAFKDCVGLHSITLPDTINTIDDYAFDGCTSLKEINLPENLTRIGRFAFSDTGLENVIIPNGVTEINEYAFYNNYLENITLPASITRVDSTAFNNVNITFLGTANQWDELEVDWCSNVKVMENGEEVDYIVNGEKMTGEEESNNFEDYYD